MRIAGLVLVRVLGKEKAHPDRNQGLFVQLFASLAIIIRETNGRDRPHLLLQLGVTHLSDEHSHQLLNMVGIWGGVLVGHPK